MPKRDIPVRRVSRPRSHRRLRGAAPQRPTVPIRLFLGSGGFSTEARREALRAGMRDFFGPKITRILFVPYALADHDKYVAVMVEKGFSAGYALDGIHKAADPLAAIRDAQAIYVGGGNTFRLLADLHRLKLLDPIRRRVRAGMPFMGVSAGTNVAGPTIKTTNDMPITWPPSLDALGLVRFQINPHYFAGGVFYKIGDEVIPYGGETRDDRIREFHEMNDAPVLGLWEGAFLTVEGPRATLHANGARCFRKGQPATDHPAGADLSFLLG